MMDTKIRSFAPRLTTFRTPPQRSRHVDLDEQCLLMELRMARSATYVCSCCMGRLTGGIITSSSSPLRVCNPSALVKS